MKIKCGKQPLTVLAAAGAVWASWYSHGGSCTSRRDSCTGAGSGRKTCGEARDVIETYEEELGNCPVILTLDGQEKETTAKELGLYWSNENQIEETLRSTPEAA